MKLLQHLRLASPAKLFAIGFVGVLVITILTDLTKFSGTPALDLARKDEGIFNVGTLYLVNPFLFGLFAGFYALYARFRGRNLNRLLVSVHFWTSLAFTSMVIWLAQTRVDLPVPNWQQEFGPNFETQGRVFIIARIIFGAAQVLFLVNLLWNSFCGRKIQSQTT